MRAIPSHAWRSRARMTALAFCSGCAACVAAFIASAPLGAQGGQPVRLATSILKGPSGISAAWLASRPPAIPGATLSFVIAPSADLVTAKLVSGEIDVAVLPVNLAAKLYNAGLKLRAAAVVGGGMVRFLTSSEAITGIPDLRGAEIAVAGQKATPDYLFRHILKSEGLVADRDYRPVYSLAYPEIAAGLAAGRIRHAVLPEPFATQALAIAPSLLQPLDLGRLWTEKTGLKGYPMSILVVSTPFAERHPAVLRTYLSAYRDSVMRTVAEPAASGALAESLDLGMKAEVAAKAIPRSAYLFVSAAEMRTEIEGLLGVFLAFDPVSIGGKLPDAAFYLPAERIE